MTDARRRAQAQEIGRAVRRRRRQHRAVHRRPHRQRPALPRLRHPRHRRRRASSRRSRTCWSTASCRRVAELAAYKTQAASRCAACPRRCKAVARAAARGRASDGRDAHRRARRSARVLPEKDDHNVAGRARHRRPADGLASARCCCTGITSATTASASTSRPTTTRSAAISCTCCTASTPPQLWVRRDAHLARSSTPSTSSTPRRSPAA